MAFVTIQDANNVFGRGFTQPNLDIDEERKLKKASQ